jgi:ribosomal silencing factor RsfS
MNLLELRKYAIDRRVEIRFGDSESGLEFLINKKGQAQIPGERKDFRVEEVFDAAEKFMIISATGARHLTREAMAREIDEAWEKKGAGHHAEEEED